MESKKTKSLQRHAVIKYAFVFEAWKKRISSPVTFFARRNDQFIACPNSRLKSCFLT